MTYKQKLKIREQIRLIKTQAGRVREACRILESFAAADACDLCHPDPDKSVRYALADLKKSGEIVSEGWGRYTYRGRPEKRNYNDIIWHLVRSHRHFTTDEIERLSGASRATAIEYLAFLKSSGILEKTGQRSWRLVRDPGPKTPVNIAKREKLLRIRTKKKDLKCK